VVSFGKTVPVKWLVGSDETQSVELKVRPLFVDTRLREYITGVPHEVTDRLFVVRRVFRLNDLLPGEIASSPRWQWERGGWLLVDRLSGRISQINLPEFDPLYSAASWYRDYISYCGVSDDGKKLTAFVVQLGRRKPVLKKGLGDADLGQMPDSACRTPSWQRQPVRVTFDHGNDQKLTFAMRGRVLDLIEDATETDDDSE
jgi:hypothetical protein